MKTESPEELQVCRANGMGKPLVCPARMACRRETNVGEVDGRHATFGGELVEEGERDGVDGVILAVMGQWLLPVRAVLAPIPV